MKRRMTLVVIPFIAVLIAIAVVGLIWLGYRADWTGFQAYTSPAVAGSRTFTRAKTLWDWMQLLIVPVVIAVGVFWLNRQEARRKLAADREEAQQKREADERRAATDRELAADNAREQALTSYFDAMAKLLLERGLGASEPGSAVRDDARAYTPAVCRRLDGHRKGLVLQFLKSNHPNYAPPNTTFNTAAFGTLSSLQSAEGAGPRQLQLAARLTF